MTHEQPGPVRTTQACAPLSRRDRYSYLHWSGYRDANSISKRKKNSKYLWTMLVLLPGKVLRGAMRRDACANLTAIKALRGSPEGRHQGSLYTEKKPLDTWYLRLVAVRPMGRKQSKDLLVDHCDGRDQSIAEPTCGNYLSFDIKV